MNKIAAFFIAFLMLCLCGCERAYVSNEERFPDEQSVKTSLEAGGYTLGESEKITMDEKDYAGKGLFAQKDGDFVFVFRFESDTLDKSELYDYLCDAYPDAVKVAVYDGCAFAGTEKGVASAGITAVNFYEYNGAKDKSVFTAD